MNLHQQIRNYRLSKHISQEELAEHIYVTRQTVSNWENGKSYPDIHSLLLMSKLFGVSLDQLVKGDIEIMKETIQTQDIQHFQQYAKVFSTLMVLFILSAAPLLYYLKGYGAVILTLLFIILIVYAVKVEKFKKENDVQTYKEILAFLNGEKLDEISSHKEQGKRPYQKFLLALGCGAITFLIMMAMLTLFHSLR